MRGKAFDYKRRIERAKSWNWGDPWMNPRRAEEADPGSFNWQLREIDKTGKRKMNKAFAELASDYWRHPEDAQWKHGDWFRFFREDMELASGDSYMYWSKRNSLDAAKFNPAWSTEEEAKDAIADMYAAEFSSYFKKYAKTKEEVAEVGSKQKGWAQSTAFLSPQDGFFSIPSTERWDGAREGIRALTDAGLRLPEEFKARFHKPKPDGSLRVVETKAGSKWGHYADYAGIMADSIALNLYDERESGAVAGTMVHETGHMIEHLAFGWGDGDKYPAIQEYYSAVEASGYPERMKTGTYRNQGQIGRQVEVFARGFMQYTASKLKKASPTAQKRNAAFIEIMEKNVERAQKPYEPPLYYSWEEFKGVERAFDNLFEVGTWRKK